MENRINYFEKNNFQKLLFMECKYHPKFKKFVPLNISSNKKCVTKNEINNFQKK